MRVAVQKTTADMVYLARAICDDVFAPRAHSIFVLNSERQKCREWWFDEEGRHESAELLCVLEAAEESRTWTLACESRPAKQQRFMVVQLRETDAGIERVGALQGEDMGRVFRSLSSCLRAKGKARRR